MVRSMRIICLLKPVPDVDAMRYDSERNVLVREGLNLTLNPEDAVAVAVALGMKRDSPGTYVETLSMAPRGAMPYIHDLVRRGVDRATLLSDRRFAGSDTWATSKILARWLGEQSFDCVLCGTHSIDGGTAHVPAQVAEALGLSHVAGVSALDGPLFEDRQATVTVENDEAVMRFSVTLPAILGFQYTPKRKLPYIPRGAVDLDVSDRVRIVGADELGLHESDTGLAGSLTAVLRVEAADWGRRDTVRLQADAAGVEYVYRFLEKEGFLRR